MSEEITQEVFVKIWNERHQLTDIDYFSSWVRTIVRNTLINHLRSKEREVVLLMFIEKQEADDIVHNAIARWCRKK